MRISAKAEYACIAILELALRDGEPRPTRVRGIAQSQQIPQDFLVQILLRLKAAGLVASTRGAAGGYRLARPAAKISVADVLAAMDPEPEAAPRRTIAARLLHSLWAKVEESGRRQMAAVTFDQLAAAAREKSGTPVLGDWI